MFICTGCQKEYENQTKFCSECGGKVEEKIEIPTEVKYICSGCQREYEAQTKFCSECGGKVTEKIAAPTVYACCQCQKEYDETTKFCSDCGGKVVVKQAAAQSAVQPVNPQVVQQAAVQQSPVQTVQVVNPATGNSFRKRDFFNAFFRSYKFAPIITLESVDDNSVVFSTTGCRGFNFGAVVKTIVTLDIDTDNDGKMQARISNKKGVPTLWGWLLLLSAFVTFGLSLIPFVFLWLMSLSDKKFAIESQVLWFNLLAPHVDCFTIPAEASYDLNGKNPVEIAQIAFKTFGSRNDPQRCCCFAGTLNMDKVQTAINSYANGVDINSVICHLCPANDSGKTGTLITTNGIYSNFKIGLIAVRDKVSYNEINMAGNWNSLICNNYSKTFYWTNFTATYNQVKDQLANSENYMSEQKELMEFIRAMQCRKC